MRRPDAGPRYAVVDTYALLAELAGSIPEGGRTVMDAIRTGRTRGVVHYLVAYELYLLYEKGLLPFESPSELEEFLTAYFYVKPLTTIEARQAARIKKLAEDRLGGRARVLSAADVATVAVALLNRWPVITGDPVVRRVSRMLGVEVLW